VLKHTIGFPIFSRPSMDGATSVAIRLTASKSPIEHIGKPASNTSTPSKDNFLATATFSSRFKLHPGDLKAMGF